MIPRSAALALLCGIAHAALPIGTAHADDDEEGLRERLTERVDRRRPHEPWSVDVAGRPLSFGGEYEVELIYLHQPGVAAPARPYQLFLGNQLTLESFYSFGPPLSIFVQIAGVWEEDLIRSPADHVSTVFVERGEMWLYSENIAGTHLDFDVGRLDFEDERRWWWDDELDAVRLAYERERYEIAIAVGQELASDRSDLDEIEPEAEDVTRILGEASWDWSEDHAVEFFFLHADDHSHTESREDLVRFGREDETDGRLTWFGARAIGAIERPAYGALGYWLDTGFVRGREKLIDFEDGEHGNSAVQQVDAHDVSGWGLDVGLTWMLPLRFEPRLYGGWAFGSGEAPDGGTTDHSYQQTDLHSNEAGVGSVERFSLYGVLLDPELSNLAITTLGGGVALLRNSTVDLVYHRYRLDERADSLRQARLETLLTGANRTLGEEFDLVVAIEEWERLEFEFAAAAFRAGPAFGVQQGDWSYGGFVALRLAF